MSEFQRGERIVIDFNKVADLGFFSLEKLSSVKKSEIYAYFEQFNSFGMATIAFSIGKRGRINTIYLPTSCFTVYAKKSGHPATRIFLQ